MQFARPQPRLPQAYLSYQCDHPPILIGSTILALAVLVIGLTAERYVSAGPADRSPLDEPLREDLPEGFFTTRTP